MSKRKLKASEVPVDLVPLVDAAAVLPVARVRPPASSLPPLTLSRPAYRPTPFLAQLQQYLGIRDVGDVSVLPAIERFPVGSPDETRTDVRLPYGVPRYVRAAMLKLLAGGRRGDSMLEQRGDSWEFVAETAVVDLKDRSRVFRVGRALIFS